MSFSSSAASGVYVEGLGKSYQLGGHTVTALEVISLIAREGYYVAFTGPRGK